MFAVIVLVVLGLLFLASLVFFFGAKKHDANLKAKWEEKNEGRKNYAQLPEPDYVSGFRGVPLAVTSVLLLIALAFSCLTTVSARSVGIGTAFGKYTRTLDNGLQAKAPWESVEEFSTQVQFLDLDSTDGSDNKVAVAYKGGGDGWTSLTVRWRIEEKKAQFLWAKYKTFDQVTNQLVASSAKDSVNAVLGRYAPNEARDGSNRKKIAQEIKTDLEGDLDDDGVFIDSVSVKNVQLSEKTQASIEAIVQANANIERARSEQERARIDAETAKIREREGALTGPALTRYCLEVTNSWDAKKNGALPATWSCFSDEDAGVIVNASK